MTPVEIKDLMIATGGSASERAVALLLASGITATKDIAEALGLTHRAVQMARKRNLLREASFAPEARFAKPTSPPKPVSPESEASFASQPTDTRARAYKESPSEISNPREREEEPTLARDVPHMNGKGFIISARDDLYIPKTKIDEWREKYTAIDLEEVVTNLSAKIVAAGRMHPGWQCPEGWMPKLLGEENRSAAARSREAELRQQRIVGAGRQRPSRFGIGGAA